MAMFEESVSSTPSLWAVVNSWFTPTVFFVVLNLMIGTIAITSTLGNQKRHQQQQQEHQQDSQGHDPYPRPQQLARSPSLLQRLKSINFSPHRSSEPAQYSPEFQTHYYPSEHTHEQHPQPQLTRSPSMLQRLKSINLYNYFPTEPTNLVQTTHQPETHYDLSEIHEPEKHHLDENHVVEDEDDEDDEEHEIDEVGQIRTQHQEPDSSLDEIYSQLQADASHVTRTMSDTKPASGEVPQKLPRKMKKSASTKSAFSHFKEDDIVVENRRPATVREGKVGATEVDDDDDDEVDAKADDFINKFKKQLQLQRVDSIMRYKEMISRGNADAK